MLTYEKEFHSSRWWAYKWLKRFDESGMDGLKDKPRSSRPTEEVSEETFAEIRRELSENPSGWKVKEIMNMVYKKVGVIESSMTSTLKFYCEGRSIDYFIDTI